MRVRLARGPRWAAAAACFAVSSVGCLAACDVVRAASDAAPTSRPTSDGPGTTVRVLQLNLCNSGRARCYSDGRAVPRAAALIDEHRPGMVSLNEVCRDDLRVLEQAMSVAFTATTVASAFAPARDGETRAAVRCRNGQDFGNGVLVAVSPPTVGSRRHSGVYPVQDPDDSEGRVWICIDLATRFSACTTHTTSVNATVALDQCRYFLNSAAPGLGRKGVDPIILGADLNLAAHGSPSAQSCLPKGYQRTDDGGVQNVVVSPGVEVRAASVIDMQGTTDHPGLLVDVVLARR